MNTVLSIAHLIVALVGAIALLVYGCFAKSLPRRVRLLWCSGSAGMMLWAAMKISLRLQLPHLPSHQHHAMDHASSAIGCISAGIVITLLVLGHVSKTGRQHG